MLTTTVNGTHMVTQLCPTQDQLPQTSVEASVRTEKYAKNSASEGTICLTFAGNFRGTAKCDTGSAIKSNRTGSRNRIPVSDN